MTPLRLRPRDGFALPVALLAMVVIGAIVTGGFYVSSQEHHVSLSTDHGGRALNVAEYGLEEALATWTNGTIDAIVAPVPGSVWSGATLVGTYQLGVMQIAPRVYVVQSEGSIVRGNQTSVRRVGAFVRRTTASIENPSAMQVYGALKAAGNATISGEDQCLGASWPGIIAKDSTLIEGVEKNQNFDRVFGDPPVLEDPTLTTESMSKFGDIDLDGLIASATIRYDGDSHPQHMAPVTKVNEFGQTVCDTSVKTNWGDYSDDPGPCGGYYPIIYVDGNLDLNVGTGQGVIIVEGDMRITGNVEFSGVVIVKGKFEMAGTGSKINGTVIVQGDGELETQSTQTGNAMVQYNSCKVEAALNNNLRVRPLASRAWFADTPPMPVVGS